MKRVDLLKELEKRNVLSEDEKAELADLLADEEDCQCESNKKIFYIFIEEFSKYNNSAKETLQKIKEELDSNTNIIENLPHLFAELETDAKMQLGCLETLQETIKILNKFGGELPDSVIKLLKLIKDL